MTLCSICFFSFLANFFYNLHPTAAFLGVLNLFIYSWMPKISYTASKRKTVWNTQWGAVVGLIPPLIGMNHYL